MVCGENQACFLRPAKVRQLDKYTQENYGRKKKQYWRHMVMISLPRLHLYIGNAH